jgi:hypothetical protein
VQQTLTVIQFIVLLMPAQPAAIWGTHCCVSFFWHYIRKLPESCTQRVAAGRARRYRSVAAKRDTGNEPGQHGAGRRQQRQLPLTP